MKLAERYTQPALCESSYLLRNTTEAYTGDAVVVMVGKRTHAEWMTGKYCLTFNRPFRLDSQSSLITASRIVASFGSVN
jgi:hypothetical protein